MGPEIKATGQRPGNPASGPAAIERPAVRVYRVTLAASNSFGRYPSRVVVVDRVASRGDRVGNILKRIGTVHADGAWWDEWSVVGYRIRYGARS